CMTDLVNSWQQYTGVNAQTGTSYAIQTSDYGQLITLNNASPVGITIPQATGPFAIFNTYLTNLGAGTATLTPTVSTINGAASFSLPQNKSIYLVSDGANYQVWNAVTPPSSFGNQSANAVLAGPTSGPAGSTSFRALVGADLPFPG